jgi:hypothetical protein
MKDRIAYEGDKFTIEWYQDEKGKSRAMEYFLKLPASQQDKLYTLFKVMGNVGKIFNKEKFNFEGEGIFAFKPQPDRFLCFFYAGRKIIVTNGFVKKQNKLPREEKERALLYKNEYEVRAKNGVYYD